MDVVHTRGLREGRRYHGVMKIGQFGLVSLSLDDTVCSNYVSLQMHAHNIKAHGCEYPYL